MKASDNPYPSILVAEQGSAPATPATGYGRIYCKTDGLYFVGDDGVEVGPLGGGSAAAGYYGTQLNRTLVGAGGAASVTISGIAAGYDYIEITYVAKSDGVDSRVFMEFNGDTTAGNYCYVEHYAASSSGHTTAGGNDRRAGFLAPSTSYGPATGRIRITRYDGTTFPKVAYSETGQNATQDGDNLVAHTSLTWENTAAVTSIVLKPNGATNFAEGSLFVVVGYKNH